MCEAQSLLNDLTSMGATLALPDVNSSTAVGSKADDYRVLALFPSEAQAQHVLNHHSSPNYKLRMTGQHLDHTVQENSS